MHCRNCPLSYEPSGSDFLSPCLEEVDLMVKVVADDVQFNEWARDFLPQLFDPEFELSPGEVGLGSYVTLTKLILF